MTETRVSGTEQSGVSQEALRRRTRYGVLVIVSNLLAFLSGALLAFDFLGYHAPGNPPHPIA